MITNSPYQSHLFMNNIQVAIIEDEKPAARLLEGMIKKLRPQWDIIKIPGSIESSVAWLRFPSASGYRFSGYPVVGWKFFFIYRTGLSYKSHYLYDRLR